MDKEKENGRNPEGEQPKKGRLAYMDYMRGVNPDFSDDDDSAFPEDLFADDFDDSFGDDDNI